MSGLRWGRVKSWALQPAHGGTHIGVVPCRGSACVQVAVASSSTATPVRCRIGIRHVTSMHTPTTVAGGVRSNATVSVR